VIEDGVFVGSDSTLVRASKRLGGALYVAAASCITDDVPADAWRWGEHDRASKKAGRGRSGKHRRKKSADSE